MPTGALFCFMGSSTGILVRGAKSSLGVSVAGTFIRPPQSSTESAGIDSAGNSFGPTPCPSALVRIATNGTTTAIAITPDFDSEDPVEDPVEGPVEDLVEDTAEDPVEDPVEAEGVDVVTDAVEDVVRVEELEVEVMRSTVDQTTTATISTM
ncbi:hypothetical protein BP5796_13214 [Coleophoma crateriformis]|uniref:Uncharacterized protein n=1 Tax=Coleophoma crateriformis TaxID=565419 RepID=A0A3D8Q3C4_9HELO|nr:hypothetical protein BP5796_13214 [Coleophoma crateriformis]